VTAASPHDDVPRISREELFPALRGGRLRLVDVLSPESFSSTHIPGAINLPVADIASRAGDLLPDKSEAIVTYCGGPT
jgi:rhodanese-related sulfurtransferase